MRTVFSLRFEDQIIKQTKKKNVSLQKVLLCCVFFIRMRLHFSVKSNQNNNSLHIALWLLANKMN